MSDRYARIARAVQEHPWAILPGMLDTLLGVLQARLAGERLSAETIEAKIGGAPARPEPQRVGAVAVLPLHGVVAQRMNMFMEISGGTSTEVFGQQLRAALADPEVAAVVIDIDSPGGSVFGVEELALAIHGARGGKPIVAVADSLAASAAYWIGAQADQLVASPSAQVGAIGVFQVHEDRSEADKLAGMRYTVLKAGRYKAAENPHAPLSDEAASVMQATVDDYYDLFLRAVARGRGVSVSDVRNGFGEGAVVAARSALAAGMVDRIETLSDVVARLSTPQGRRSARTQAIGAAGGTAATPQEPLGATGQEPASSDRDARLRLELELLNL